MNSIEGSSCRTLTAISVDRKSLKVGEKLGIGVENINMLADTYLAEGSTVRLYGRQDGESVSYG